MTDHDNPNGPCACGAWHYDLDGIETPSADKEQAGITRAIRRASLIAKGITLLQIAAHNNACDKGFWDKPKSFAHNIALMHSELSEALEGDRHGDPKSDKIPEFTSREEELADTIIRIADVAAFHHLRLGDAIVAKLAYNESRPKMHGKAY